MKLLFILFQFFFIGLFSYANETQSWISDQLLLEHFTKKMVELHQNKKTTPIETLIKQLKREKCSLILEDIKSKTLTPQNIYKSISESTIAVGIPYQNKKTNEWDIILSTGFFISSDGAFVTNYHVVNLPEELTMGVMTQKKEVYPVKEVLAASKINDISIKFSNGFNIIK